MILQIVIETDNDSFGNDRIFEVQRIIGKYLPEIKTKDNVKLYDFNGNAVGYIQDREHYLDLKLKKWKDNNEMW